MSEAVRLAVMRCAARRKAQREKKSGITAQTKQSKPQVSKLKPSPPVVSQILVALVYKIVLNIIRVAGVWIFLKAMPGSPSSK